MRWFSRPRRARGSAPILTVEKLDVYYGRAHALQEVSLSLDHGATAVVGRNGMGKTTLCNAITGLVPASGQRPSRRRGDPRPAPQRHHRPRGGLRAAGPARLALPHGGRAPAPRLARPGRRLDGGARVPDLPATRGAQGQRRRRAVRGRAADARHRAGAPLQPDPPRDGRADRGPGAGDRAAGGRDAEAPRRRRRDLGAADRAEPRRRDRRRRHRRRHGQRPHRAVDAVGRAGRRPRPPAAPPRREGGPGRGGGRRGRPGARRGRGAGHRHRLHDPARDGRRGADAPVARARAGRPSARCAASPGGTRAIPGARRATG